LNNRKLDIFSATVNQTLPICEKYFIAPVLEFIHFFQVSINEEIAFGDYLVNFFILRIPLSLYPKG